MCGRFTLTIDNSALAKRFHVSVPEKYRPTYNAAPAQNLPVIFGDDTKTVRLVRWGIEPEWMKGKEYRSLINIRTETILQKRTFQKDLEERRCIIPADGFYEWRKNGKEKQPYRIMLENGEPFSFAGLWEICVIDGQAVRAFAIITAEPNRLVRPIHDRMPVILDERTEKEWLGEGRTHLLAPYPDDRMIAYEVSRLVNRPTVDSPDLIAPMAP